MSEQSLGVLQQWMQAVVTERGGLTDKLQAAKQRTGLRSEDVVVESRGFPARQRLGVYAGGYVLRLLECLRADFPALRSFVGDAVFDAFAKAYIISEPPVSRSLFHLSAGFPAFLERTKPIDREVKTELIPSLDLPPEIAHVERARADVLRAAGIENDPPASTPFLPQDIISDSIQIQTTPCLRLLELKFPLVEFMEKLTAGELPATPAPGVSFVAICRANYRVHLQEITRWQFEFLKCCDEASSIYVAAQRAAERSESELSYVLAQLMIWLPVAMGCGFLRRM